MQPGPDSPANSDAILAGAEDLARSVLALKARRGSISAARRKRIGDRDGWTCHVCRQPIDPDLKWWPPDLAGVPDLEADLRGLNPTDAASVLAWVGGDPDRAEVAQAWTCGVPWRDRYSATALAEAGRPERDRWTFEFYGALRAVSMRRTVHNREVGTVEHLIPVVMGGGGEDANLAIAHRRCNTHVGAAGATNADLLDAPRIARRFLEEAGGLRDAREVAPALLSHYLGHFVTARQAAGVADPVDGRVAANFSGALNAYADRYAALWTARRECMRRVEAFAFMYDGLDVARHLRSEIRAADRKINTLVRADAIGRWRQRRAVVAALLPRAEANPSFLYDTLSELGGLSGHAHGADWWRARRDEFPEPPRDFVADFELPPGDECPYCVRRGLRDSASAAR